MIAVGFLVLTILLGTSAIHSLLAYFAPAQTRFDAMLWLVLYGVAALGLMFNHGINWISWLVRYRILLVILLLGTIVSVFWSIDTAVSAERTVHVIGCSVIAIYLGFMVPLLTTLRVLAIVLGGILLSGVAAAIAMPDLGIENYEGQLVWKGILNSKNSLGFWSAIGVLLYLTLIDSSNSFFGKFLCFSDGGGCTWVALVQSFCNVLACHGDRRGHLAVSVLCVSIPFGLCSHGGHGRPFRWSCRSGHQQHRHC